MKKAPLLLLVMIFVVFAFISCDEECVHEWGEAQITDSTCTTQGESKRTCKLCEKTEIVVLELADHTYGEWVVEKAATCGEGGSRYKECSVCADKQTEVLEPLGHSFSDEWTVDTAATCTTVGSKSHPCDRCDEKIDVTEIPVSDHILVTDPAVGATCQTAGKTEGSHCEVCNAVIIAQEDVPVADHKFVDGECVYCGKEDEAVYVVDAVDLSARPNFSDVIIGIYGQDWADDYPDNEVEIPKLTSTHVNALAFNQKIYNKYQSYTSSISAENMIVRVEYEAEIYKGVVAIAVNPRSIPMGAGGDQPVWDFYYYDTKTNTELDFNGYLAALGLTYESATEKLNNSSQFQSDFKNEMWVDSFIPLGGTGDPYHLIGALFGADESLIAHTSVDSMYSYYVYETASILK